MIIKRRREITVETERSMTVKLERRSACFACADCGAPAEMLSINEAANRARVNWREIVSRIETGEIHFVERETGEIYVCATSLKANVQ